jgi:hypothetical protein
MGPTSQQEVKELKIHLTGLGVELQIRRIKTPAQPTTLTYLFVKLKG